MRPSPGSTARHPDKAVLLVEEKPICRMAIVQLLAEIGGVGPVRYAASIQAALDQAEILKPELLVVDLFSINYEFGALRRLLSLAAPAAAIVVDDRVNPTFARLARDAGASGYASKDFELSQFKSALQAVFVGGAYFPRDILPDQVGLRVPRSAAGLSARQLEVLKQMAVGKTNREIGEALGITPGTVKLHIHSILQLTGARNRTEAALIAGRFLAPAIG